MKNIKLIVFIFSLFVIGILFFLDNNHFSTQLKNNLSSQFIKAAEAADTGGGGGGTGNSTSPLGESLHEVPDTSSPKCTAGQDFNTSPSITITGEAAKSYCSQSYNSDASISLIKKTDTCTGDISYNCIVLDSGTPVNGPGNGIENLGSGPKSSSNPNQSQTQPDNNSGTQTPNSGSSTPNNGSQNTPTTPVTQTQAQGNSNNANSTDAQFTNVCSSGYVACSASSSCNSLYDNAICSASCSPDQKYCDGQGKNHVYKWVCDGKNQECGNGIGGNATLVTQSTSRVDLTSGVSCGKTVQLDVFDKQCDAGGGWNCNASDLKGYMTYYTGACNSGSTPPAEGGNACTPNSQYTNICSSGYVSCSSSSSCNSLYNSSQCPASCNPDTQTCDGQGTNYVYKWICNGNDQECGGNGPAPIAPPVVSQGQQNIASGLTCGQTAQLDVFDKQCDANGGWDCDGSDLKGYLVYYSGDCSSANSCQQPTSPATPSASLTPTTPASPSATPTGPACGSTCTTTADCVQSPTNSCTVCVNGTCQAPTPTPTPSFNPNACHCDGTTVSSIIPGGQVTVTSKYKVEGADQSTAKLNSLSFYVTKGDNATGDQIAKSGPIPAQVVSIDNNRTEYQAQWTFTMPTDVDPNAVYKVFNQPDCTAQTGITSQITVQNVGVASVQDDTSATASQKQGFFASILDFFKSLIGQRDTRTSTKKPTLTPTPTTADNKKSNSNLQLGTIAPAKVIENACTVVRFEFPMSQQ